MRILLIIFLFTIFISGCLYIENYHHHRYGHHHGCFISTLVDY
jgi:hypothetical protein